MGPRQHSHLDVQATDREIVTPVNTRIAREHPLAHQALLQILERGRNLLQLSRCGVLRGQFLGHLRANLSQALISLDLLRDAVGFCEILLGDPGHLGRKVIVRRRGLPFPGRFAGLGSEFPDDFNRRLHLLVPEQHRVEHDLFGQQVRFGFHHQHRALGPGDHKVQLGGSQFRGSRIDNIFFVYPCHAGGADRSGARQAGQGHRRECAQHGRNVRINFLVVGQHRGNDLNIMKEALGEHGP